MKQNAARPPHPAATPTSRLSHTPSRARAFLYRGLSSNCVSPSSSLGGSSSPAQKPLQPDESYVGAGSGPVRPRGTTQDAARILGCSPALVRRLIACGELRRIERPGKRVYVLDLDEVHAYRRRKMQEMQFS